MKKQRIIALLAALALLICCAPVLGVEVKAADTERYLYNGCELPALPEWDRAAYPYAFMYKSTGFVNMVTLYICESIVYESTSSGYSLVAPVGSLSCYVGININVATSDSWSEIKALTYDNAMGSHNHILWSNFDVLNEDGTLYLSASEPIPVGGDSGSTDTTDPTEASGEITSIDLSRTGSSCYAGTNIGISVDVTGTGEYDESCTCTVSGGTSSGTYVELDTTYDTPNLWYLYVGADETAETLTITATSNQDPTVTATHTVTVLEAPSSPEVPTLTGNVPSDPIMVNVGDAVPTLRVVAEVSDGGTLSYQWFQTVDGTSSVISGATSSEYTPTASQAGEFYYYCRVYNTNENGSAYADSNSAWVTVSTPATEDSSGSSSDDGSSSDSGENISDVLDQKEQEAESQGNAAADEVISIIPDQSADFISALDSLISVLNYEGTAAVLTMPAVTVPSVNGLFPEFLLMEEQKIDFEYYISLFPEGIIGFIRALFDVAIVGYCLKELLDLIGSALTGFGSGFSKQLMEE